MGAKAPQYPPKGSNWDKVPNPPPPPPKKDVLTLEMVLEMARIRKENNVGSDSRKD